MLANVLNGFATGTWQDSTADDLQPPSNVTRLSRVISRNAILEENGEKKVIPQIVYYQKGVGTGFNAVDKLLGGAQLFYWTNIFG